MRTANLSMEEALKAEKEADDRRQSRGRGFSLARNRDKSQHTLSNGVTMLWHVPRPTFPNKGGPYVHPSGCKVPEDSFILEIDGKEILFDTDEFRKWLRWA